MQIETFTGLANATVTSLVKFFSAHVADDLDEIDFAIGGPNITVEIDETKLGKRKYHRGHRVEGVWILVGIERTEERKLFLRILPDRSAKTLEEIILQHVQPGSTIVTDCWRGYSSLESLGYTHLTVNHSKTFRDEQTGACTNTVEGTNNAIKMSIHPRNRTSECEDKLWEFIWRRRNVNDLWEGFLRSLRDIKYN
jgi:IS1 family transposase